MPTHLLSRKAPCDSFNGTSQSGRHRCQQRPGVMLGRKLDRRWEAVPARLECLSGKTTWQLASVHVLLTVPDTKPEPLKSILFPPGDQSVFWLLALAGTDSSSWTSHRCFQQGEIDSMQHFVSLRAITGPRPSWEIGWCLDQKMSSVLSHISILRWACVQIIVLLLVASAASVTSRLGHWTCWAFKATALRVPFPGIHVHPSLSCDLLRHYVGLKNVYVLR